ncbi:MAG: DUF4351 domain-containing protein [Alphaproteobacteria bacterium]|nr:DUF4351 domain-containing protein [Alphaproteobacteria bacterium]
MTAGEMLIEQGRIQGHQAGHQEGLAEGEAVGRRAEARRLLLRMLSLKFGELPRAVHERVAAAELEALEAWTERIFAATRAEDVVA